MTRHLAAILAADIAGYARLMGADQAATLAALRQFRADLLGPTIARNRGRIAKSMGDGWLVEFASAADAVSCAIEVQDQLAERPTIRVRIGVHLGDVVCEEDDVFGAGVNVAARLQELAEPGSVIVSDAVYGTLDGTLRPLFGDRGEQVLKNIELPVRIWGRSGAGQAEPVASQAQKERPSIAVLAFSNLTGDPEQDWLADGLSEEIQSTLARNRWLGVVARNSSFAYKGRALDVREIARQLGARYVLDGSVRRAGDRIRVGVQLIDGQHGTRLWGERYDREIEDILALQEEIAATIAGTVEPELSAIEGAALRDRRPSELSAWDCYRRGLWHLYRFTIEELGQARDLFERAIGLDPSLSPAYARLAYVHIQLGFYGSRDERPRRLADAIALSRKALELDDRDASARVSLGRALTLRGDAERGIEELKVAVELDPSFAQAHFALAQAFGCRDRAAEALEAVSEALRLSPRDPHLWTFLTIRSQAHYISGELDAAADDARAALRQPNATFWPALLLVATQGRAGRREDAAEAIEELNRFRPGMTCADARAEWIFCDRPFVTGRYLERFCADLRAAGLPE